jgi:hypothetical protein
MNYQPLFDYLHKEHDLILTESEMDDLIRVVRKSVATMTKQKYNLTFWQRFWLPVTWLTWKFLTSDNPADNAWITVRKKKSWHEVKKGMEKHTCRYTVLVTHPFERPLYGCEHEGCNRCCPPEHLDADGFYVPA